MLALFGGFAARGLVDVDALQVRYSRPRHLELAAGRTVVLTGRSSPKRWPPPPGRPDGAFERLGRGLNAQALAGLREGAYQRRAELDAGRGLAGVARRRRSRGVGGAVVDDGLGGVIRPATSVDLTLTETPGRQAPSGGIKGRQRRGRHVALVNPGGHRLSRRCSPLIPTSKTSSPARRAAAPAPDCAAACWSPSSPCGAFALALLLVIVIEVWLPTTYVRSALGIGFLGGFTTFSSVVTNTERLAGHGAVGIAARYLGLSTVAGLALRRSAR